MDVNWWAFVAVVALAYLIPGPDFAIILRSATRSPRAGVAAALGAQTGLLLHMGLAVVGLSVVLAQHPGVLTAIRVLGGAYLLYLGGRLILPTLRKSRQTAAEPREVSVTSAYGQALFTNLLNPKAVLFFAAVLPQFLDPTGAALWMQILALGVLDIVLGLALWALVILVGVRLAGVLRRPAARRWWDRTTGAALAGTGGTLVLTR
jgi:threonine/homoserine/homoserine lactone efflux protein